MVFGKYKNEKKAFASHVGQTGAVQGPDTYVYHVVFQGPGPVGIVHFGKVVHKENEAET